MSRAAQTVDTGSASSTAATTKPAATSDLANRFPMLCFAVILVIALSLRLFGLDREGYWGDEYLQVTSYDLPLHYTIWSALTRHAFGPPDFVIGWIFHRISPTVWMCRLPSALWGTIAVVLCFLLARKLTSWRAGLIAAGLLTVCPLHLVLSQEVRPYSICLAFMLGTLYLLVLALQKPSRNRLLAYAIVAVVCTMTRSFIPCVFLAVIGFVMTVGFLWSKSIPAHSSRWVERDARISIDALRRVWLTTLGAGCLALIWVAVMFAALPQLPPGVVALAGGNGYEQNIYQLDTGIKAQLLRNAAITGNAMINSFGVVVVCLAAAGVLHTVSCWNRLPASTRYVLAIMMLSGPAVTVIYSIIGGAHLFYERYSFYLMPFIALFAGMALAAGLRRAGDALKQSRSLRYTAWLACLCITFAYPASSSAEELQNYRRIDWRGCATYLSQHFGARDVIMVLTEAPFGRVQQRFFGKYDWHETQRPLGEAMWTLAISDNHFERLLAQTGMCVAVVARRVHPQRPFEFKGIGLQKPPDGCRLVKFRGLDVLIPNAPAPVMSQQVIELCDAMLGVNLRYESTKAIPLALKARLLKHLGRGEEAAAAYDRAGQVVPPTRTALFKTMTTAWQPERSLRSHRQ